MKSTRQPTIERRPVKRFSDLTEQEVLALAITNEEEDSRIYRGFAEGLREQFPSSAKVFDEMAEEEVTPPHQAVRPLPQEIRRLPAADPPPGRQGLHPAQVVALADAAARPRRGAQVRREHGIRGRALLSQGGGDRARRLGARIAGQARRGRSRPRESLAHKLERAASSPRARAPRKTRPRGACSCCNMCSRAWPG